MSSVCQTKMERYNRECYEKDYGQQVQWDIFEKEEYWIATTGITTNIAGGPLPEVITKNRCIFALSVTIYTVDLV